MFCRASSFSQPLERRDTSQVTDMSGMFSGAGHASVFVCVSDAVTVSPAHRPQSTAQFVSAASRVACIVASEMTLADVDKQIPSAGLGGLSGGLKFVHDGIVFKVAQDMPISGEGADQRFVFGSCVANHALASKVR